MGTATLLTPLNFIHEGRDLQFKIDPERQIFEQAFLAILVTLRVFKKYSFFYFVMLKMPDVDFEP